jgi:hypothetical protein
MRRTIQHRLLSKLQIRHDGVSFTCSYCLLGDMNMVAVRVQQTVRDGLVWPFTACPRPKKLDGITLWLHPAAVHLQSNVQFVPEVAGFLRRHSSCTLLRVGWAGGLTHCYAPFLCPLPQSFAAYGIDINRTPEPMQP